MKRLLTAALAALALSSCGGDPEKPGPVADVDLEAECRAASEKWKTLQAVYKAEGGSPATLTLAFDRNGRAALRVDPGIALVLDGSVMSVRLPLKGGGFEIASVPIGRIFASAVAISTGANLPGRGDNPLIPAGHVVVDLSLQTGERGNAERSAVLAVSLAEATAFGWLDLLHPREGFTIRSSGRTAVVSGPLGRISIDRDSGALVEWTLEPSGGRAARLATNSIRLDLPLEEAMFKLEGPQASAASTRDLVRTYTVSLMREVLGDERDDRRRLDRSLAFARAYFRCGWTDAEIDRLATLGAAHRKKALKDLRVKYPDLSQADIEASAERMPIPAIHEALQEEVAYDLQLFGRAARPADDDGQREYMESSGQIVEEELVNLALEASRGK